jgi:hypothetical protein
MFFAPLRSPPGAMSVTLALPEAAISWQHVTPAIPPPTTTKWGRPAAAAADGDGADGRGEEDAIPDGIGDGRGGGRAVPAGLGKQRQERLKARKRRQMDMERVGSGMHVAFHAACFSLVDSPDIFPYMRLATYCTPEQQQ